ncbi:hypothetical protein OYC64_003328 [Pagothenia borchgrevinki]|uniref:LINE-1 type transposase domain-containing protein 1 n=1 Tax=Pagothenia borchgrevinki TaxID=8213 RepID=A0ABD2FQ53_PAGBO
MATLQGDNSASKECEGSSEANANTIDNTDNAILQAINGLKTEFSSKLDGLLSPPASPIVVERAHRLSGPKLVNGPPRPLIMKFLNYKDKVLVQNAARQMGKILYKDRQVMLFLDVSAELHKQRRRFDGVKRRLREMDVQYGIVFPARLRVTHGGRSCFFDNPSDRENFIKDIQK